MSKRYVFVLILVISIAILTLFCNNFFHKSKYNFNIPLEKDMNFSQEISGMLSESSSCNTLEYEEYIQTSRDLSGGRSLRWGIKRGIEGRTPDANPGAQELLKKYDSFYLGDVTKKQVFLTFDEGYENGYTSKILDVLKTNSVKAAFFITGPYIKEHMDLVERMVSEGHTVGNHTVKHLSLPEISDKEIEREVMGLDQIFYEKFKKHMKFLRPPKGEYSERTLSVTRKLGYKNVFWSFAYEDWYRDKSKGAEYAEKIVLKNLHNGGIILLHAVSKDNTEALDSIIKNIRAQGYEIKDISEIS